MTNKHLKPKQTKYKTNANKHQFLLLFKLVIDNELVIQYDIKWYA